MTILSILIHALNILLATKMITRHLRIILTQMSGYIKYFDNGGRTMPFMVDDDSILVKYNDIWKKNKKLNS